MADPSLSVAISEIARNYARDNGVTVTTSYISFKEQQTQLTEGGAADVLITPLPQWVEELKTQGLIDVYSPTPVAKNRLALVGPVDSPLEIDWNGKFPTARIINLIGGEPGFVVGNPDTLPEGVYARETLRTLGAAEYLEPYTLYPKQLSEMFGMVINQKAYGLFFASSISERDDMRVISVVPENLHKPIQYYAVVIAGENMTPARTFLEYLKTEAAQSIFREDGL